MTAPVVGLYVPAETVADWNPLERDLLDDSWPPQTHHTFEVVVPPSDAELGLTADEVAA